MSIRVRILPVIAFLALVPAALAQSTAFTYQGELKSGGAPANGLHDLRFSLWNAATGGSNPALPVCVDNVQVTNGKFTATIDFGSGFVASGARFIEVAVRQDTGLDCTNLTGFSVLSPRTQVNAAPFATYANRASALAPAGTGFSGNAVNLDASGNVGIGTTTPANRLSVAGSADITGNVGIGTVSPANPLSVAGAANFTGNVGIGTATPGVPLHIVSTSLVPAIAVASPFAVLRLQDTGPNSTQTGYVDYRNSTGTETAWVGFGSPGDPDFSIVNARAGGDIVLNPFSGNVGVGTSAPAARLDVRGDVKLGPSGQFFAVKSDNSDRVIRGRVGGGGAITAGTGFTITHTAGTGTYVVNFNTPFATPPIAVASSMNGTREVNVFNWGTTWATIGVTDHAGAALEGGFSFIVIGE